MTEAEPRWVPENMFESALTAVLGQMAAYSSLR